MPSVVRSFTLGGLCLAMIVGSMAATGGQKPDEARTTAIVGGMLLDGWGGPPLHHATVLIQGNRIVEVGTAASVTVPANASVIDASGRTIMPGLIEAHAHLFILGHGDYPRWFPWMMENKLTERVMEISARQMLNAGITTAVDVGDPLDASLRLRDRSARNEIPSPRLVISGTQLVPNRNPGAPPGMLEKVGLTMPVTTPESAVSAVNQLLEAGVDIIKLQSGFSAEHYRAIVGAARKRGKKVHAHVYTEQEVTDAFEAGVDVLQHVGSGGTYPPYTADLVRRIAQSGRPIVDTIAHRSWVYPATEAFPERLQDPQLLEDFGRDIYDEVQRSFKHWHTLGYFNRIDSELFFREQAARQWIDSGAVMGMGTDSGTPLNFHTEALWREMQAHVEMGMAPSRVIVAATRINATRVVGRNDLGTIEPGKLADLIVVNGNPLADMSVIGRVEVVVKDGVVVKNARDAAGKTSQ